MTKNIELLNAYTQRGWDSCDHLIDDSRMTEIVGRSYTTVTHAMRAASARASRRGFVAIRYLDRRTGEIIVRGNEPALPGRAPLYRCESRVES